MESDDVHAWRKLIEGPSDFDKSRELDAPRVANPVEYVYVERSVGFFSKPEGSILRKDEPYAVIPQGSPGRCGGAIEWCDGEPWVFEIRYNYLGEVPSVGRITMTGPEGMLATYVREELGFNVTLFLSGAKVSEVRTRGTRAELWSDGAFVAEYLYVWRDSDEAKGIKCRVYVDSSDRNERTLAALMLILGNLSRTGAV